MEAYLRAFEIQAFDTYKSADGSEGVTALEAGIQFKNGLYVGGTFSAAALPITTNNITINGAAGNGYIQYGAQTIAPSLALVHTYADAGGHFAIGQSGSSGKTIVFENGYMTADRDYAFQDKSGTLAMTGDNLSTFVNDSGYVVGPAVAVDGNIPSFDGTTGSLVQDSGIGVVGTAGKVLNLVGNLTVLADTSFSGGGSIAMGGFALTVPATGTAVLTARSLTAGAGLTGGGTLAADRTFDVGAGLGITVNANDVALTTPGTLTVATINASTGSHTHAITSSANPGAAASILATDSSGFLRLVRLGIGATPTQPLEVAGNAFINAATANLYMKDTSTGLQVSTTLIVTPQTGNSFRSTSFTSGVNGWTLDPNYFETGNGRFRGELAASVFKISEISATAGTFGVFYSASTVDSDFTTPAVVNTAGSLVAKNSNAGGMLFAIGDYIRIKSWTGAAISDSWLEVSGRTNNGSNTTYAVILRSGSTSAVFRAGTAVVDYGPSGTGFITLSTDGTVGSSPNLTMATHSGSPWSTFTTLLRLGNLNGSYGYATDAYGLGVGSYGGTEYITIDPANGLQISGAAGNLLINSGGLRLLTNTIYSDASAIRWNTLDGYVAGAAYTTYLSGDSQFVILSAPKTTDTTGQSSIKLETRKPGSAILAGRFGLFSSSATSLTWATFGGGPDHTVLGLAVGSNSAPTHMLDVYGTGWFTSDLTVGTGGTGNTRAVSILNGGSGTTGVSSGAYVITNNNTSAGSAAAAFGTEIAITGVSGNSNTKATLYSSGSTYRLYGLGAGTVTTDANGNITITSDERLKTHIRQFRKGLDVIRRIEPILYRWNKKSGLDTKNDYVGFGASHTKKHLPEAVGKGLNGFRTMNDRTILAAVVNAIKELEQKYESLPRAIRA